MGLKTTLDAIKTVFKLSKSATAFIEGQSQHAKMYGELGYNISKIGNTVAYGIGAGARKTAKLPFKATKSLLSFGKFTMGKLAGGLRKTKAAESGIKAAKEASKNAKVGSDSLLSFMNKHKGTIIKTSLYAGFIGSPLISQGLNASNAVSSDVSINYRNSIYSSNKITQRSPALRTAGVGYETMATKYNLAQNRQLAGLSRHAKSTEDLTLALHNLRHRGLF